MMTDQQRSPAGLRHWLVATQEKTPVNNPRHLSQNKPLHRAHIMLYYCSDGPWWAAYLKEKTMTKFTFDTVAADQIAEAQKAVDIAAGDKKRANEAAKDVIDTAKVGQYAQMMAALKDAPRKKGQLSRTNRKLVEDALAARDININKGAGKRLYDGSVAITNPATYQSIFGEAMPTQATAEFFEARLVERQLDSEKKIIASVFPSQDGDDIEKIVRKVVGGYTYAKDADGNRVPNNWRDGALFDRYNEVIDALHNAKLVADAMHAAAEEKGKENVEVAEVLASLDLD